VTFWIAFGLIFDGSWRRIQKADFPWNGPDSRTVQYQKTIFNFPYTSTEERWENTEGEMIPYWQTFSIARDCLRKSELMASIINDSKSETKSAVSPYHFYLVSINPEIVIVSEQEPKKFDYWNLFVLPTTKIPESKNLYWVQPETNPEPVKIDMKVDGNGSFEVNKTRINIRRNSDKTFDVIRAS